MTGPKGQHESAAAVEKTSRPAAGPRHAFRLRRRFVVLLAAFAIAMTTLVALGFIGLQALSGARAYVHGESQWTKAQKQAVISLLRYADAGDA
ncbi:MAG: hypothetical protein ACOCSR_04380, partial [Wenzhouxiangella sp.]